MSKTYTREPGQSYTEQLRVKRQRKVKRLTHREREQQRERFFIGINARAYA